MAGGPICSNYERPLDGRGALRCRFLGPHTPAWMTPVPKPIPTTHRILVVDDNAAIHGDFRKVLGTDVEDAAQAALAVLEADLFGETRTSAARPKFEITSAHQGEEAVEIARNALAEGRPFAMAFVDMRMPPGWDGLQTIE